MRSTFIALLAALAFVSAPGVRAQDLYRKDEVSGAYYKVTTAAYVASRADTAVVLTIRGNDTTKVVTIRDNDPARGVDETLRKMFGLQVATVLLSVVATVLTVIVAS